MLTALGDVIAAQGAARTATSSSRTSPTRRPGASSAPTTSSSSTPSSSRARRRRSARSAGTRSRSADRRAYLLQTGEKALIWVKLVAHGAPRRTARTSSATTPSRSSPRAVARIGSEEWPVRLSDHDRARWSTEVAAIPRRGPRGHRPGRARPRHRARRHGSSTPRCTPRRTPRCCSAGYKHNVIPDAAEALDRRPLPAGRRGDGPRPGARARRAGRRGRHVAPGRRARAGLRRAARRRRAGRPRPARPGGTGAAVPALGRDRQQGAVDPRHRGLRLRRRCSCRPASTSPRCSTASTSGCRSTRWRSAACARPTCCSATETAGRRATSDPATTDTTEHRSGKAAPVHILEAIFLGFVQGLTEFLPVSSSAHLRIVGLLPARRAGPGRRVHRR